VAPWAFLDINGTVLDTGSIDAALGRSDGIGVAVLQEAVEHAMVDTITGRFQPLPEYLHAALARRVGADEVQVYKPHPRVYEHALHRAGCEAGEAMMVASHWWDLLGASRAGLRIAFVARHERELPSTVPRPVASGPDLVAVADAL
jgi:beta-phosphoglucomutase-like phosphatase (HAD superfamily)